MAKNVEVQIPKDLRLTKKEMSALEKSFKKRLVDTLKAKQGSSKASPKLMVMNVRAKSKNEVV
jgi:hypothetical protein